MSRHVIDLLTPYLDAELSADRMSEVATHLLACPACRATHEELRRGRAALKELSVEVPPAGAWDALERALDAGGPALPRRSSRLAMRVRLMIGIAATLGAATLAWILLHPSDSGWNVAALHGMPRIGAQGIGSRGQRLAEGEWLETDAGSSARLSVGNIGHVQVDPGSRVRISRMPTRVAPLREGSHRLELERGSLHAVVTAPPRLFVVDMPAASAVDLGCAYSLIVLPSGDGRLTVTAGRVSLERDGREAVVLAGAACEMHAGSAAGTGPGPGRGPGPGTPYFLDATKKLRDALHRVDTAGPDGDVAALADVLDAARVRDSLTLWHLVAWVGAGPRERVVSRLEELSARPDGVTREGVMALDDDMLRRWRQQLETAR